MGLRTAEQLPAGHVCISVYKHPADDQGTDYYGPILTESDTRIRISVWGEPMQAWRKRDCNIIRSAADTRASHDVA
jgi:hypothetical protein